jgi:hypothetical protein
MATLAGSSCSCALETTPIPDFRFPKIGVGEALDCNQAHEEGGGEGSIGLGFGFRALRMWRSLTLGHCRSTG